MKLNRTDLAILQALQSDAKKTHEEIGKAVSRDASVVTRRIAHLRSANLITGYHAALDQTQIGLPTTVYTLVALKQHSDNATGNFEALMDTWPNVVECSKLSSSWDFLLKIIVQGTQQHDILHYKLLSLPDVSRVRGMHVIGKPRTKQLPLEVNG